jgi:cytoskeleton protein RodZ
MPEIGDQLRETRMRSRIDIAEVEAATKIRAKYLRALENEEWDLLPGPTFVKTFLRTYADYLGLDARMLVEEYRQRYERPSQQELTALRPNLAGRRGRRRRGVIIAPWMVLAAGFLLLVGALYLLGTWGDDGGEPGADSSQPVATATPTATPESERRPRRRAVPRRVRLRIVASGPVSVCLEAADGTPLIPNVTMDAGQRSEVFRGRRFLVSFGTGAAVMRVNGRVFDVSDDAPIGYEIRRRGPPRPVPESRRPTCGA